MFAALLGTAEAVPFRKHSVAKTPAVPFQEQSIAEYLPEANGTRFKHSQPQVSGASEKMSTGD
ncbi:MAG TPA: hypothetical protein VGR48_20680 [Terriglobales bacterium]|nr:hypothetical protein [Terriglobales bacterium]